MLHFKAKMHQIRFPLALRPRPCGGAYSTPQIPYLRGLLLRRGEGKGKRMEKKGEKELRGVGRDQTTQNLVAKPLNINHSEFIVVQTW